MEPYSDIDVSFDVPASWRRRAVIAYARAPDPSGFVPTVVLTRDPLLPNETLRGWTDKNLAALTRRLARFRLLRQRYLSLQGVLASELHYTWTDGDQALEQRMVSLVNHENVVCSLTATATPAQARSLQHVFDRCIASLRLGPEPPWPLGPAP